jgi:hypothetical protein
MTSRGGIKRFAPGSVHRLEACATSFQQPVREEQRVRISGVGWLGKGEKLRPAPCGYLHDGLTQHIIAISKSIVKRKKTIERGTKEAGGPRLDQQGRGRDKAESPGGE